MIFIIYYFHKQSENINKFYNSLYKTIKNKKDNKNNYHVNF